MIGDKKIVAVCVSKIQDDGNNDYISALNDVVSNAGYNVIVYNTGSVSDAENYGVDTRFYVFDFMDYEILNEIVNPGEYDGKQTEGKNREMILLFDSNHYEDFRPYPFSLKDIVPSLQYCLDTHCVIVISALHHMGVPMGYVSFYFLQLDHTQSSRITQIVNALCNAFGGYRNTKYKNYLMHQIEEMYRIDSLTG